MWLQIWHDLSAGWMRGYHFVSRWPWATIAAFISSGAAVGIARNQTKERQHVLARENVVQLAHTCLEWSNQAAALLGAIRRYLLGHGSAAEVNNVALNAFMERCNAAT
jgi:hypothetical protein